MSQVIIYQEPDGSVSVIHPAVGKTVVDCVKNVPEGAPFKLAPATVLPGDRYFRDAWEFDNGSGVSINVEKAKEVQRNVWRKLRAPKLAALDADVIKAMEKADTKTRNEIAAKKQALRDVTETPLPDDIAGIRNTIPEILL